MSTIHVLGIGPLPMPADGESGVRHPIPPAVGQGDIFLSHAGDRLGVRMVGKAGPVSGEFNAIFRVDFTADPPRIVDYVDGDFDVHPPLILAVPNTGATWPIRPTGCVPADDGRGFDFVVSNDGIGARLSALVPAGSLFSHTLAWESDGAPTYHLRVDAMDRNWSLSHAAGSGGSAAKFVASLGGERHVQLAQLESIEFDLGSGPSPIALTLAPVDRVLSIAPEFLTPKLPAGPDNPVMHQFTLANGRLESRQVKGTDGKFRFESSWKGNGDNTTVLLLHHVWDEHGLPLCLEIAEVPLRVRDGIIAPTSGVVEQTTPGIVFDSARWPKDEWPLKSIRLHSGRLLRERHPRAWLKDGRLPLSATAPREAHGFAEQGYLSLDAGTRVSLEHEDQSDAIDPAKLAFQRTSVRITGAARLHRVYPEREYVPAKTAAAESGGPAVLTAGAVRAVGQLFTAESNTRAARATVRLPATDLRLAVANIALPAAGAAPAIFSATEKWFEAVDEELRTVLGGLRGETQRHAEGFVLAEQEARAVETILGRIGDRADTVQALKAKAIELKKAADDFVFGDDAPLPNTVQHAADAFDAAWTALSKVWDEAIDVTADVRDKLNQARDELLASVELWAAPALQAVRTLQIFAAWTANVIDTFKDLPAEAIATREAFETTCVALVSGNMSIKEPAQRLIWMTGRLMAQAWSGPFPGPPAVWPPPPETFPPFTKTLHAHCLTVLRIAKRAKAAGAAWAKQWDALKALHDKARDELSRVNAAALVEQAWLHRQGVLFEKLKDEFESIKQAAAFGLPLTRDQFDRLSGVVDRYLKADDPLRLILEAAAAKALDLVYPQFRQQVLQGWNQLRQELKRQYEENAEKIREHIRPVRDKFRTFTDEALNEILDTLGPDALNAIAAAIGLGENAGKLLHLLRSKPPAYVLVTKSFEAEAPAATSAAEEKDLLSMWLRRFRLCGIGGRSWDFNLDNSSTVILKLSADLTIEQVLTEIQQKYAGPAGTADPLRLWSAEMDADDAPGVKVPAPPAGRDDAYSATLVGAWVKRFIDPDVAQARWRGIFIVGPVADLSKDTQTSTLCGLRFLSLRYAAIGGRPPAGNTTADALDVYATIFRQTDPLANALEETDAKISLVRFDARIKNARLRGNSSIELRLDIDRLLGRYKQDRPELREGYENIRILGTLKPSPDGSGESFEFAAVFEKPLTLPIDFGFVHSLALKQIRAGKRNGTPSFDIDADLYLQDWELKPFEFETEEDKPTPVSLTNFRLTYSDYKENDSGKAMGFCQRLHFDFGSVAFRLPKPKTLSLRFVTLKLTQMGYVRAGGEGNGFEELQKRLIAFRGGLDDFKGELPYFVFDVDFDKLPSLGRTNVSSLKVSLLVGLGRDDDQGKSIKPVVGLMGVTGHDITIDLFRVLTVTIRDAYFKGDVPTQDAGKAVTLIGAEDVGIAVAGRDLIGGTRNDTLNLLMARDGDDHSGFLVSYVNSPLDDEDDKPLFRIEWFLLGRDIKLTNDTAGELLKAERGDLKRIKDVLTNVVTKKRPQGDNGPPDVTALNATMVGGGKWLFGVQFCIGKLLEDCRLILHDENYYGIRLTAEWLGLILEETDTIALAYIPGPTGRQDRFLVDLPLPRLDLFGAMRAGWLTLSWAFNCDFLVGFGFPWRVGDAYQWNRSFSYFVGIYEAKFGFYIEKRTVTTPTEQGVQFGGGVGFYIGYGFAAGNSVAYVRAGIGVFGIVEGALTFAKSPKGDTAGGLIPLRGAIVGMTLTGVIGIYAYGEGGIDVWVISAKFRVSVQASLATTLTMHRGQPATLGYTASLSAEYAASVRVGKGWFSFSFSVSGSVGISVSGQLMLN